MTGSTAIPSLRYRDAHAAIEWLERTFGFTTHALHEGPGNTVAHAQLTLGPGMIMLGSASDDGAYAPQMQHPADTGQRSTHAICLTVPDASALYERAHAAGAEITAPLADMPYGGKAFGCKDPEGYLWSIGEYDPWAHA